MSCKELRRAGVMERVKSGELKLVNAAVMMGLSYRQTKRLAKRYREVGAKGLKHGSAGRESNRRKPRKFRERVLRLGMSSTLHPASPMWRAATPKTRLAFLADQEQLGLFSVGDLAMLFGGILIVAICLSRRFKMRAASIAIGWDGFPET